MPLKFKIPCIHEAKGVPSSETVADYHPLTLEEVSTLIQVAYAYRKNGKSLKVSDIQGRLNQGIMGMTCPQPIDGEIYRRMNVVDKLFIKAMKNDIPPDFPSLAVQLFENMMLESDDSMLAKSIDELELSFRSHNLLKINSINTIGELTRKTETEMLKMRNMGRKSLSEIKDALLELGLCFAMR